MVIWGCARHKQQPLATGSWACGVVKKDCFDDKVAHGYRPVKQLLGEVAMRVVTNLIVLMIDLAGRLDGRKSSRVRLEWCRRSIDEHILSASQVPTDICCATRLPWQTQRQSKFVMV